MNPIEILRREHEALRREINNIEEMTYSPSVNVRDFSFLFKELFKFWDMHEEKERKLFGVLNELGFDFKMDTIKFNDGDLIEYRTAVTDAINSGDESRIKELLHGICGELVDILKAHLMAQEMVFDKIDWNNLDKESLEKIELLQILPTDEEDR